MVELIWDGKYTADGRRTTPVRLALPFQDVETVNESSQTRTRMLDLFARNQPGDWRNRLIWGDKKYVLPSLLPEFAGKVDLIYIDPPFATGADFSFTANLPDDPTTDGDQSAAFLKQPSMIEQKAYRDTWGRGLDSYLQWFYETVALLHELLSAKGSLFVHLDWHIGQYAKVILDEIFGKEHFINEIIWWYYNKFQGNINHFAADHDQIFWYSKSDRFVFHRQLEERDKPVRQIKRVWDKDTNRIVNQKDEAGRVIYQDATHRAVDDVWRLSMLQPADQTENLRYPTQKPESLLRRIIDAASNEGDLVLDCFAGSGTTVAASEKLHRRWIAADLGRFAIHTTRKRLLSIPEVRPFVVQNLGKYERQAWQAAEFGPDSEQAAAAQARYRRFILDLYHADPIDGYSWLHGVKAGHFVHVGSVDAPVVVGDIRAIAQEFWKAAGKGAGGTTNRVDVLGWDFAFEMNELDRQMAADANVNLAVKRIPREVLDKKAVEQGDIRFFELAALDVRLGWERDRTLAVELRDFVVPPDDIPEQVQRAITHWSQLIDYWAVDWDYRDDTFHNEWQTYRTKQQPKLALTGRHEYYAAGPYRVLIKVIDILGNDTTKAVTVEAR